MELIAINKKSPELRAVKKLFLSAFPKDERVPFGLLVKRADPQKADFWSLLDGGELIGMAYVVKSQALAYLYFLAIAPDKRGKGYGTKTLDELKAKYNDKNLFLALETLDKSAPNYAQRVKRHAFYESCGFTDLPYRIKEASVVYGTMGANGAFDPQGYRDMMSDYLGKFHTKKIDPKMF